MNELYQHLQELSGRIYEDDEEEKSLQHVIDDEGYEESSKKARERDHISFKNMPYIIVNDFERDPNLLNYLMGCDVCTKSE